MALSFSIISTVLQLLYLDVWRWPSRSPSFPRCCSCYIWMCDDGPLVLHHFHGVAAVIFGCVTMALSFSIISTVLQLLYLDVWRWPSPSPSFPLCCSYFIWMCDDGPLVLHHFHCVVAILFGCVTMALSFSIISTVLQLVYLDVWRWPSLSPSFPLCCSYYIWMCDDDPLFLHHFHCVVAVIFGCVMMALSFSIISTVLQLVYLDVWRWPSLSPSFPLCCSYLFECVTMALLFSIISTVL